MKILLLGPIRWHTPPRHYGPWERITRLLADGISERSTDVPRFATLDSITLARLEGNCARPCEQDDHIDGRVWEALRVACRQLAEQSFSADRMVDSYLDVYERVLCDR